MNYPPRQEKASAAAPPLRPPQYGSAARLVLWMLGITLATSVPLDAADLSVTATTPASVFAGDTIAYQAWVQHVQGGSVTAVTAAVILPETGLGFVTATADAGTCAATDVGFACAWATFPSATTYALTATLATLLDGSWPVTTTLIAAADTNASNSSTTVAATVLAAADLAVGISATPTAPNNTDDIVWQLTLLNRGPSAAASVTLTATLSGPGILDTAIASNGDCTITEATAWCGFGTVAASNSISLALGTSPQTAGTLTLSVAVTSPTHERSPADNATALSLSVTTAPTAGGNDSNDDGIAPPAPLSIGPGPNAPTGVLVASLGEQDVPLLQFSAGAGTTVTLRGITLRPDGSGDETRWIRNVELRLDADGDGSADANEPVLASGVFTADNAPLTLALNPPQTLAAGSVPVYVVTFDLGEAIQASAPLGRTWAWALAASLLAVVVVPRGSGRTRRLPPAAVLAIAVIAIAALAAACGSSRSTPEAQTYQVTLTGVDAVRSPSGTTLSTIGLPVVGAVLTVIND